MRDRETDRQRGEGQEERNKEGGRRTSERFTNMVTVDVDVFRARRQSPCPILH